MCLQAGVAVAIGNWPVAFDLDLFYIAPFYHRYFNCRFEK